MVEAVSYFSSVKVAPARCDTLFSLAFSEMPPTCDIDIPNSINVRLNASAQFYNIALYISSRL